MEAIALEARLEVLAVNLMIPTCLTMSVFSQAHPQSQPLLSLLCRPQHGQTHITTADYSTYENTDEPTDNTDGYPSDNTAD
jgi:hypothetical protein